jgi:hypothetical protein
MTNPINPIEEAKALKAELSKIIADFGERTKCLVTDIKMFTTSQRLNMHGHSFDRVVETELRKLVIESQDGAKVEV